jgi:hypothetical protein
MLSAGSVTLQWPVLCTLERLILSKQSWKSRGKLCALCRQQHLRSTWISEEEYGETQEAYGRIAFVCTIWQVYSRFGAQSHRSTFFFISDGTMTQKSEQSVSKGVQTEKAFRGRWSIISKQFSSLVRTMLHQISWLLLRILLSSSCSIP